MELNNGQMEEYKHRHNTIWPELSELLKKAGISNYSIFLDEDSNILFGVMDIQNSMMLEELSRHPVMQRWWAYMSDIMETNVDNSPVTTPLKQVFHLP